MSLAKKSGLKMLLLITMSLLQHIYQISTLILKGLTFEIILVLDFLRLELRNRYPTSVAR